MLDVRKPIGLLFGIMGMLLAIAGLIDPDTVRHVDVYGTVQVLNLDVIWGVIMLSFGLGMLALSRAFSNQPVQSKKED